MDLGKPALHWVGLVDGLAKFAALTATGKLRAYSGIGAGAWFGEGTLMRRDVWRYEARALRPCELALLPRDTFFWLLDRNLAFNRFILGQLNDRLELMTLHALDDGPSGADALVARTLRHLFHPLAGHSGGVLQITQQEIGQFCGLSRQRVNQALKRLERDGVIGLRYGGVEVRDVRLLRDWRPQSGASKPDFSPRDDAARPPEPAWPRRVGPRREEVGSSAAGVARSD